MAGMVIFKLIHFNASLLARLGSHTYNTSY